ncbi:inositol monophosphatase family protein [Haloplanus sp. C73]|uniref:inositol monophosphatase family protein n=1 Tax=Haloplanus sp. C73 TaxID=3421641 RepID=UPI003EBB2A5C
MDRHEMALTAARAGADLAMELFRTTLTVETKSSATDYVTEADTGAQRRIIERITEAFPDDAIVGEEGDQRSHLRPDETAWVIDPIDGTTNYVRGLPIWVTSVAAVEDGDPVAAANVWPALETEYHAGAHGVTCDGEAATVSEVTDLESSIVAPTLRYDREYTYAALLDAISPVVGDIRRFGSAQATLSLVADGRLDAAVGLLETRPWDTVAGVHLIERAGGRVTDLDGDLWTPASEGIVASNGAIHDDLLAALPD